MSKVIPKEQLTAYQRWELEAFERHDAQFEVEELPSEEEEDEAHEDIELDDDEDEEELVEITEVELPAFPTAEEIEKIHQDAHAQGYQTGFEEGRAAGYTDGLTTGRIEGMAQAKPDVAQFQEIVRSAQQGLLAFEHDVAEHILALSIQLAQQILHQSLKINPEGVLPIIREALRQLPYQADNLVLTLHPDDLALVERLIPEGERQSWKLNADAQIHAGGCRIDSSLTSLDATLETRWQRILAALGQEGTWLAQ